MIENCYQHATGAKAQGKRIVCILCEYTPRELIMAAGGVPICLCGGAADTIPAAEEQLPANLCPLIKSTFGYHVKQGNPFLEMADLIVGETTCDGKKKMYELMADSRPMFVLELPQRADDSTALQHWADELRRFHAFLEERFGITISADALRKAIGTMNRERALRRELAELMKSDCPPLTGRQLLAFKSSISGLAADLDQYERALAELVAKRGAAPSPKGTCSTASSCCAKAATEVATDKQEPSTRVRVLMTGVPIVHGAERVLEIIENCGGLVVCTENCTGVKPLLEDVDETAADPLQALAEKYYHLPCSVMTPNERRLESLRTLVAEYRPDCIIELIWQACLTYDVESDRVRRLAEQELGIGYLRIETDYSPSDSARIAVRVEALFETVRGAGVAGTP